MKKEFDNWSKDHVENEFVRDIVIEEEYKQENAHLMLIECFDQVMWKTVYLAILNDNILIKTTSYGNAENCYSTVLDTISILMPIKETNKQ